MPNRTTPPPRREGENIAFEFQGRRYVLTIGRYADGRPCEVFVCGETYKNSDMDNILHDASVLASIALQHGVTILALAKSLATLDDGSPATVIAKALSLITPF